MEPRGGRRARADRRGRNRPFPAVVLRKATLFAARPPGAPLSRSRRPGHRLRPARRSGGRLGRGRFGPRDRAPPLGAPRRSPRTRRVPSLPLSASRPPAPRRGGALGHRALGRESSRRRVRAGGSRDRARVAAGRGVARQVRPRPPRGARRVPSAARFRLRLARPARRRAADRAVRRRLQPGSRPGLPPRRAPLRGDLPAARLGLRRRGGRRGFSHLRPDAARLSASRRLMELGLGSSPRGRFRRRAGLRRLGRPRLPLFRKLYPGAHRPAGARARVPRSPVRLRPVTVPHRARRPPAHSPDGRSCTVSTSVSS
jgi:hypothetical protein